MSCLQHCYSIRNSKLFLCVSLFLLIFCASGWVTLTHTPISTKLPLFIRSLEDHPVSNESRVVSSSTITLPDKSSLPFRDYIKNGDELKEVGWIMTLHDYLKMLNKTKSPHVHMVFGDYYHRFLVLNWLVGALVHLNTPLPHALVLSLDQELCNIVYSQMYTLPVTCITAPVESIIAFKRGKDWNTALMVRPLTVRLINFWGYDVATYDSDAILLKNPQVLYDQYPHIKLLGSPSIWPSYITSKWGFSLCAGALLLKASSSMENLWIGVSDTVGIKDDRDEQIVLNEGLINVNITWKRTTSLDNACSISGGWEGIANHNLTVYVFSQKLMCRSGCCDRIKIKNSFIVHPFGTHIYMDKKVEALRKMNAWFLN